MKRRKKTLCLKNVNKASDYREKIEQYIVDYTSYVAGKLQAAEEWSLKSKFLGILPCMFSDKSSNLFKVKFFEYRGVARDANNSSKQNMSINTNSDERIFLVIPSLFNSSSILHFDHRNNFVKILQEHGRVFLLDWLEFDGSYVVNDVVDGIVTYIGDNFSGYKIDLVGHCIGGVIAAAVTNKLRNGKVSKATTNIASLTLLTCSWDFSHFKDYIYLMECLELDKQAKSLKFIPKTFIQIMFFMLNPEQFNYKIDKYFASCIESRQRTLEVEYWLQSGISLPTSLYIDLIENIIKKNILSNRDTRDMLLRLGSQSIDPSNFDMPVFILYCQNDQIVPKSSVKPLIEAVRSKTVVELQGGHINYLVKNIESIRVPYNKWLEGCL